MDNETGSLELRHPQGMDSGAVVTPPPMHWICEPWADFGMPARLALPFESGAAGQAGHACMPHPQQDLQSGVF